MPTLPIELDQETVRVLSVLGPPEQVLARWRSQRRMRFSTRAATLAISARVGAGPSRHVGMAGF